MWLLIFINLFAFTQNIEVIPTKPEIKYFNAKYIRDIKVNIQRKGRGSPYYVNIEGEILYSWGNNVTLSFEPFEYLSGNYVPSLFKMAKELCHFFHEPIVGKMLVDQLPQNLSTCPVPKGWYTLPNLVVHLKKLPFNIPFTYEAVEVRGRVDFKAHITDTEELIAFLSFHGRAIQRPKNKQ